MRWQVFVMGSLLGGCTLLNSPDLDLTPPAPPEPERVELFCDDGLDDDEDLDFDCEDSDCSNEPACCEERTTTLSYDWTPASLDEAWSFSPDAWSPTRMSEGGTTFVGGFVPNDSPRALVSKDCVSLGLGGWVETTVRASDSGGCASDEPCDDYAGVVLTAATGSAEGFRLQDELGVTLYAGGLVAVTQAGVEIARASVDPTDVVPITVVMRPKLDDLNRPYLSATVRVDRAVVLEEFDVLPIENLIHDGDCADIPGLRIAVEGRGERVFVGPLESAKQDCANPGQFDEQSATLRAANLDFNPSWVEAYVGAPTLASSRNSLSDVQWDLIVEGSNWSPELEPTTHVGYAIGHARIATDPGGNWRLEGWSSSSAPKVGADPPACVDPGCEDNRSVREPHLLAELSDSQELRDLTMVFAREIVDAPIERDRFGLQVVRPVGAPGSSLTLPGEATVEPDDVPGCISMRDPALIPVDPEANDGYWLLFTCIEDAQPPRQIRALRISRELELVTESGAPIQRLVLDADELGPFAAGGIRGAEPVIRFADEGLRIRVWFIARDAEGRASVAMAEARTHETNLLPLEIPEPLPFVVNPVLRPDATVVLDGCGPDECTITGIAVTPRADDSERLRFVLARRLKDAASGAETFQLIPLEQTWRTP
jgi:hypothetical protein